MRPKAVVFDLGKVLLDFDYGKVAAGLMKFCALSRDEIASALDQSALLFRYETGLITSQEFFEEVKRVSEFCGEYTDFEPIFADIFAPIPEMIALQARLRESGMPTYIFSNTNEIAVRHIRATYPFFATFTGYVFSYEHRCMKPEPGIYEVVERMTKKEGPEIAYIDDRPENVEQGRARGWLAIHHLAPEDTIAVLRECGLD